MQQGQEVMAMLLKNVILSQTKSHGSGRCSAAPQLSRIEG